MRGTWMISMQTKCINPDNLTREMNSLLRKLHGMQSDLFKRLDDRIGLSA